MLKVCSKLLSRRVWMGGALVLAISSCQKTPIQFGQPYVDNSFSNIVLVDTFSTQLSTVHYDSVATSGSGTLMVGNYSDPYFGKIQASTFFELSPPGTTTLGANAGFDSLQLILVPDKSFYGDTTVPLQISVYQLSKQITFPVYQTVFYNNSDFPVNPVPLGSLTQQFYPHLTDSLFIRLSDTTGQHLFNLIKSNDPAIQSTVSFLPYFNALKLTATAGNMNAIYGFKESVVMRLYYHENDVYPVTKFVDFKYYNSDNTQFNQVMSDRTGTPLAGFNNSTLEIPSDSTGHAAYLQYLTGFLTKIRFPTIRDLLLRTDYTKILKADLIINPLLGSYNPSMDLPPNLVPFTTDQYDLMGSPLPLANGSGYQTGNLVEDYLYNQNTSYTYDVTAYLQQQIGVGYSNKNGLLLVPPSPAWITNLNRAVFGDKQNPKGSIQLKVYYVSVTP